MLTLLLDYPRYFAKSGFVGEDPKVRPSECVALRSSVLTLIIESQEGR